jgi:hypothetical protein
MRCNILILCCCFISYNTHIVCNLSSSDIAIERRDDVSSVKSSKSQIIDEDSNEIPKPCNTNSPQSSIDDANQLLLSHKSKLTNSSTSSSTTTEISNLDELIVKTDDKEATPQKHQDECQKFQKQVNRSTKSKSQNNSTNSSTDTNSTTLSVISLKNSTTSTTISNTTNNNNNNSNNKNQVLLRSGSAKHNNKQHHRLSSIETYSTSKLPINTSSSFKTHMSSTSFSTNKSLFKYLKAHIILIN